MADPLTRTVLCGGVPARSIPAAWRAGDPETTALSIGYGNRDVHLKLAAVTRGVQAGLTDAARDLLDVATYVYAADQAVSRGGIKEFEYGDRWRRRIGLVIPVRCVDLWNEAGVRSELVDVLEFLTDDEFAFHFVRGDLGSNDPRLFDGVNGEGDIEEVCLFSGGLDSLCGAVEEVLVGRRRVALLGHRPCGQIQARQKNLADAIRDRVAAGSAVPLHVGLTANKKKRLSRDFTQRSRSFLFAAAAAGVATAVGLKRIRFYENGVTGLNLPISPQLVGARASRTTHPRTLAGFAELFGRVFGQPFVVENPYRDRTKAEILARLASTGHADLCRLTCSCVHTIKESGRVPHCGTCSQCVDRRLSVIAAGLTDEHDPSTGYRVDPLVGERDGPDLAFAERYAAMAEDLERMPNLEEFVQRFPEALDAARHLAPRSEDGLTVAFGLLKRHATAFRRTLGDEIARRAEDLVAQRVPARSLIGAVLGRVVAADSRVASCPRTPAQRGLVIDRDKFELRLDGARCYLGNTLEFRLAERLHQARGTYLPIRVIGRDVWDDEGVAKTSVQRVVSNLRRAIREHLADRLHLDGSQKGHYSLELATSGTAI